MIATLAPPAPRTPLTSFCTNITLLPFTLPYKRARAHRAARGGGCGVAARRARAAAGNAGGWVPEHGIARAVC